MSDTVHDARLALIMFTALQQIAEQGDDEEPEPEDYDDTESAYSNGMDVGMWECAEIARKAIERVNAIVNPSAAALAINASDGPATDPWADHPTFSGEDWRAEVAAGETRRGYAEWVAAKMEEEQDNEPETQCDDWPSCECGRGGPDNCFGKDKK